MKGGLINPARWGGIPAAAAAAAAPAAPLPAAAAPSPPGPYRPAIAAMAAAACGPAIGPNSCSEPGGREKGGRGIPGTAGVPGGM